MIAHSKFLRYNATSNPLSGISGVYVINLKRRPDRLETFKKLSGLTEDEFHLFEAVDGRTLSWTPQIARIFENNKFKSRASEIGCGLSHLQLWRHIASRKRGLHLILEDDAIFAPNWVKKWNKQYFPLLPHDVFV